MPSASRGAVLVAAGGERGKLRRRRLPGARKLHTWAGLGAGLWLAVLGITGFILDHRHWDWLWQATVPVGLVPSDIVARASTGTVRLYQVDPAEPRRRVSGGPQGLWLSNDSGEHWEAIRFRGSPRMPAVNVVIDDPSTPWSRLWLGTGDGLWELDTRDATARRMALAGRRITALARAGPAGDLLAVVDRHLVFRLDPGRDTAPVRLDPGPLPAGELPARISLSRLVHDLHFGRGLVTAPASLLINDIGGWLMLLLPAGGFLFWWLPRRWKSAGRARPRPATRKRSIRWLYRLHGPTLGLVAVIPFLYLTVTGILLDHARELRPWMKSLSVPRALQPPVYRLRSWEGEIFAIAGYPDDPARFSLGTRLGLFSTADGGRSWTRETGNPVDPGFVWTLRRHGNDLLIGGMGGPNLVRHANGAWQVAENTGHMPTDISRDGNGGYLWLNREGLHPGVPGGQHLPARHRFPLLEGVPWYFILDGLHSGLLIHPQWKWVNDGVALACLLLTITGLVRWWRQRWI